MLSPRGVLCPPMNATSPAAQPTPCPKCRSGMVDVAVTPHPLIPQMRRHTFVCYTCNQTRTYMLPVENGGLAATAVGTA
jgi:hypothetical protein